MDTILNRYSELIVETVFNELGVTIDIDDQIGEETIRIPTKELGPFQPVIESLSIDVAWNYTTQPMILYYTYKYQFNGVGGRTRHVYARYYQLNKNNKIEQVDI